MISMGPQLLNCREGFSLIVYIFVSLNRQSANMNNSDLNKEGSTRKGFLAWATDFGRKNIDYKMSLFGSVFMGTVVFLVNFVHLSPILGCLTAGFKQGLYTLVFGGFIMKGCENLATRIQKRKRALVAATLIPSLTAIVLTFIVHSLRGTPHPIESTVPTALGIFPTTVVWGIRKRKRNIGD
jgi:hypothetical protein